MIIPETIKKVVFLVLVLIVIGTITLFLTFQDVIIQNAFWILLLIAFLLIIWRYDFILLMKAYERAVIFRFGKVHRVGGPGWALYLPPAESAQVVDLRVQTIDIPKQEIVTKDNIELRIDAVIYMKVRSDATSVVNSVIQVEDYRNASRLFTIARIRAIAGDMTLREVISNIHALNEQIKIGLEKLATNWGIEVTDVEIKDIDIPRTVLDAMHNQKAAEQEKLARMERAKGMQAEIVAVREAAAELTDKALSYYYIRALEKLGEGKSTKFIFPMEIVRLSQTIAKGLGSTEHDPEKLVQEYAPIVASYLKDEKKRRKLRA